MTITLYITARRAAVVALAAVCIAGAALSVPKQEAPPDPPAVQGDALRLTDSSSVLLAERADAAERKAARAHRRTRVPTTPATPRPAAVARKANPPRPATIPRKANPPRLTAVARKATTPGPATIPRKANPPRPAAAPAPTRKPAPQRATYLAPRRSYAPPRSTTRVDRVIQFALAQRGEPYRWAADGPGSWDCSGLVMVAYRQVGVGLPHSSRQMLGHGVRVSRNKLRRGDLVWPQPGHVGIYLDDGRFIHAPRTGDVVKVSRLYGFYAGRRQL